MASSLLLISTEAPAIRSTDQFGLLSLGLLAWEHIWEHIWDAWQAEGCAMPTAQSCVPVAMGSCPEAPSPAQTEPCFQPCSWALADLFVW